MGPSDGVRGATSSDAGNDQMNVASSTMDAKYKIKKPRLLFEHDPCGMVAFSMDMSSGPRFAASPEDWVVAAGRLSLYGLQESSSHVIFLRLGSIIHPIVPRLRCWRIGRCKFVFPLPTGHHFWRLEIGDEDVEVADALAGVLSNVLRLELESPFHRSLAAFHDRIKSSNGRATALSVFCPAQADAALDLDVSSQTSELIVYGGKLKTWYASLEASTAPTMTDRETQTSSILCGGGHRI